MVKVWFICAEMKSSKRVLIPDPSIEGVRAGVDWRHLTALM